MNHIIVATHGKMAEGIVDTLNLIMGFDTGVKAICAYTEEEVDYVSVIQQEVNSLKPDEQLIVCTDLFGGSVNNACMIFAEEWNVHLIAGINLNLLLQLMVPNTEPIVKALSNIVALAKEGLIFCRHLEGNADETDF